MTNLSDKQTLITGFAKGILDDVDASAAQSTLQLVPGTNVQVFDAALQALAALTYAADKLVYATGEDTFAVTDLTHAARDLLDDSSAAAMRTTLGLDGVTSVGTAYGTFMPELYWATEGNSTWLNNEQNGAYAKIGRMLFFFLDCDQTILSKGTAVGELRLRGFPETASVEVGNVVTTPYELTRLHTWPSTGTQLIGNMAHGDSHYRLFASKSGAARSAWNITDFGASERITVRMSGFYRISNA